MTKNFLMGLTTCAAIYLLAVFIGCSKPKLNDFIVPQGGENSPGSSIRLFNFFGFDMDVKVNNIPLTSYSASNSTGVGQGLSIFPNGVWHDGTSFTIPTTLLDKNGKATLSFTPRQYFVQDANSPLRVPNDTTLADDPLHPLDYYLLSNGGFITIPRSAAVPSQADHFKIRVINFTDVTDTNMLTGAMTLTYADGSNVDPAMTNVARGVISDYVELPYGAYEFKVFANQDFTKQLSEVALKPNFLAQQAKPVYDQEARFGPIRTFKPGGIYTVVVNKNVIDFPNAYCTAQYIPVNTYRIIQENSPPVNTNYSRVQAVNAATVDGPVRFEIDGAPLGQGLAFGAHTDYSIVINGPHHIQAYDAKNESLADTVLQLYPYDNVSVWVYGDQGSNGFVFSANDLNAVQTSLQLRFLNLCTGTPYATFTNEATPFYSPDWYGVPDTASSNVPYGKAVTDHPYLEFSFLPFGGCGGPFVASPIPITVIRVFSSNPGPPAEIPGIYLDNVAAVVPGTDFIANASMYTPAGTPQAEPGAYTVGLIGRSDAPPGDPYQARMIVLKHNK